jgi:uncharacterized Zn-finger protein
MHFQTDEELQRHSQSHRGDRYYKCNYDNRCSYSAKTLDKLNAHLRYHSGERPFKCDFIGCHQDFIQSHHLARHRKSHFGSGLDPNVKEEEEDMESEDQFHCQYCHQLFDDESELAQHKSSQHSGETDGTEPDLKPKKTTKRKHLTENQTKNEESVNNSSEIEMVSEDGPQEKV